MVDARTVLGRPCGRDARDFRTGSGPRTHSGRIAHRRLLLLRRHALFFTESRAPDYFQPKTHRHTAFVLGTATGRAPHAKWPNFDRDRSRSGTLLPGSADRVE